MKNRKDIIFLIIVCLLFFVIANVYNFKTDVFGGPDEFGHFEYIKYLNTNHHLPAYLTKTTFWEAHQPPLYYMYLAPLDLVLEKFLDVDWQVRILRMFSSLLGVLSIISAFLCAKFIFSKSKILCYSTVLVFAFWPMFLFVSGVLNNDGMAILIGIVMIYFLIRLFLKKLSSLDLLCCGVVASLAFLTKMTLYPLVALFLLVLLIKQYNEWKKVLLYSFVLPCIVFVSWVLRNWIVVGDALGMKYANKFWKFQSQNLFSNFYEWLKALSKNFVGVFGQADIGLDPRLYQYFMLFVLFALALSSIILVLIWRQKREVFWAILINYIIFAVLFLTVLYYSLDKYQPQGRYLLPGLFCVALIVVLTLSVLVPDRLRFLVPVLLLFALGYLNVDAMKHIDWKNDHKEVVDLDERNDLLNADWKVKFGKWKKTDNGFVSILEEEDSFLRSDPNLRLYTNEIKDLSVRLKTNDSENIKLWWRYAGDNDFDESNMIALPINSENNFQDFDFVFDNLKKNNIVQILKFSFDGNGDVEFGKIRLND